LNQGQIRRTLTQEPLDEEPLDRQEKAMAEKINYGVYVSTDKPFETTLQSTRDALKARGFGILWEIDVKATMKAKLDVDFTDYVILGACNPPIAHQALTAEPNIGLLLPCNLIVRREGRKTVVGAIEPHELMGLTKRTDLGPFADMVGATLREVVDEAAKE
jgi:uncharacterized protein (DUF302 family)